jgi:opacity protein-like surface antigen
MKKFFSLLVCLLVIGVLAAPSYAQEQRPFEFGLYGGYASGPYDAEGANYGFGAGLDVPLIKEDPYGNQLSGEIFFSWNHGQKGYGMNVGSLGAVPVTADLETITVNADLKYTFKNLLANIPIEPYILGGIGVYIFEVDYEDFGGDNDAFLKAQDVYLGTPYGLAGPAYPHEDMPFGWAHTEFGFQVGTGFDYYVLPCISVGLDYRYNIIVSESEGNFHQVFSKIAFHF